MPYDRANLDKKIKELEKDFGVKSKEIKTEKKAEEISKKEKLKKKKSAKKRRWKKILRTKPPKGHEDVEISTDIAANIVSFPFDIWAQSRHPLWKLTPEEESKLAKSFVHAFGPIIPWMIKKYFPVISFFALVIKTIEVKRRTEAKLIMAKQLEEFTPRARKKILRKLDKMK